jgi:hypothetical protein
VRLLDVHPCWLMLPCNRPIVAAILLLAVGQPCFQEGVAQHAKLEEVQLKHMQCRQQAERVPSAQVCMCHSTPHFDTTVDVRKALSRRP